MDKQTIRQTTVETEAQDTQDVFSGEAEVKGKTASSKKEKVVQPRALILKQVVNTCLYKWVYDGVGQVPTYLRGMYTSPLDAKKAFERYKRQVDAASAS